MSILDGLRNQWESLKNAVDPPKPKETPEQRAESMKSLQHDKLPISDSKALAQDKSPLERKSPAMAEKAQEAQQARQAAPPSPPPATPAPAPASQKQETPTKNEHQPITKSEPTVAQPNVTYSSVPTPTGNKTVATQQKPSGPEGQGQAQQQSKPTQEVNSKLKDPSVMPHERMAAKIDKAPAGEAKKVAESRAETGKKLEWYADKHQPKQGMKP